MWARMGTRAAVEGVTRDHQVTLELDFTHMPPGVGRIRLACSQVTGTVSWWLTWLIFRQIGTHR
jgi:hypothetical protein